MDRKDLIRIWIGMFLVAIAIVCALSFMLGVYNRGAMGTFGRLYFDVVYVIFGYSGIIVSVFIALAGYHIIRYKRVVGIKIFALFLITLSVMLMVSLSFKDRQVFISSGIVGSLFHKALSIFGSGAYFIVLSVFLSGVYIMYKIASIEIRDNYTSFKVIRSNIRLPIVEKVYMSEEELREEADKAAEYNIKDGNEKLKYKEDIILEKNNINNPDNNEEYQHNDNNIIMLENKGSVYAKESNIETTEKDNTLVKDLEIEFEREENEIKRINNNIDNTIEKETEPILNRLPDSSLLKGSKNKGNTKEQEFLVNNAKLLEDTMREFGIEVSVKNVYRGPVITLYEFVPKQGIKLNKITGLADNIALNLAAKSVRIIAPIPGKRAIGIEIPNMKREIVSFREIIESAEYKNSNAILPLALGKDITGKAVVSDLSKMPHLLIAGTTGSGKSVCVNSLICSQLFKYKPDKVRFLMIDPKVIELKIYNGIPHLLTPVITDPRMAIRALKWLVKEMARRYNLLDKVNARDIKSYNKKVEANEKASLGLDKLYYIIVIIDEFADLMAITAKKIEVTLARLAAMARAVGIHIVLATQRPSVDVITGIIKANFPARIAFQVASKVDSRTIIDQMGAEQLLGKGDMLFLSSDNPVLQRIQGAYLSEEEVEGLVDFLTSEGEPHYIDDILVGDDREDDMIRKGKMAHYEEFDIHSDNEDDPLFEEALNIVKETKKASASYLQRRLKIGYNRAARIVELMEEKGYVGPPSGSKPRQVLI